MNLRTTTVSFAIYKKRAMETEERRLIKEIKVIEETVQSDPNQENIDILELAKDSLEQLRKQIRGHNCSFQGQMARRRRKVDFLFS